MRGISSIIWSSAPSDATLAGAPLGVRMDRRARRLRLRIDTRTGGLVLTIPAGVSRRRALAWAASHEDWAAEALRALPGRTSLRPGSMVPYRGRELIIVHDAAAGRRVRIERETIIVGGPEEGVEGRLVRCLRGEALALLTAETMEFAERLGRPVTSVAVGDARSRWGSCSSSGTIRYSWRLILAPDFVRRATVAHEVAHLRHMDHSPRFHALVGTLLGEDPAPARLWLKREGAALHRIGAA